MHPIFPLSYQEIFFFPFYFPLNCKNRNPSLVCIWHEHKKVIKSKTDRPHTYHHHQKKEKQKNKKIDFLVNFIEKEKSFIYNNNNYLEVCEERIPSWTIWFLRLSFTFLKNFWLAFLCLVNLNYFNDNPQQENENWYDLQLQMDLFDKFDNAKKVLNFSQWSCDVKCVFFCNGMTIQ